MNLCFCLEHHHVNEWMNEKEKENSRKNVSQYRNICAANKNTLTVSHFSQSQEELGYVTFTLILLSLDIIVIYSHWGNVKFYKHILCAIYESKMWRRETRERAKEKNINSNKKWSTIWRLVMNINHVVPYLIPFSLHFSYLDLFIVVSP